MAFLNQTRHTTAFAILLTDRNFIFKKLALKITSDPPTCTNWHFQPLTVQNISTDIYLLIHVFTISCQPEHNLSLPNKNKNKNKKNGWNSVPKTTLISHLSKNNFTDGNYVQNKARFMSSNLLFLYYFASIFLFPQKQG